MIVLPSLTNAALLTSFSLPKLRVVRVMSPSFFNAEKSHKKVLLFSLIFSTFHIWYFLILLHDKHYLPTGTWHTYLALRSTLASGNNV